MLAFQVSFGFIRIMLPTGPYTFEQELKDQQNQFALIRLDHPS